VGLETPALNMHDQSGYPGTDSASTHHLRGLRVCIMGMRVPMCDWMLGQKPDTCLLN